MRPPASGGRSHTGEAYGVELTTGWTELLKELAEELPTKACVATIDVARTDESIDRFERLFEAMGSVDLVVLSAAVGDLNDNLDWPPERDTVGINVRGFTALAVAAMNHFEEVELVIRSESPPSPDRQCQRPGIQRLESARIALSGGASVPGCQQ